MYENEMDRECSTHKIGEVCREDFIRKTWKGTDHIGKSGMLAGFVWFRIYYT
jgi:hypothetical protein